ncbi:class I SAM-dependent methyltransferase [Streptomyces sp. NPDC002917]|uniref:class I SAM-dependent methyltransferase n=1 Tax=Streptomyces sp. NPDC002917 TaxID=3364671 RepID=UPI003677170A
MHEFSRDILLGCLPETLAGQRVLDLGCGEGIITRAVAARGAWALGTDPFPRMIEQAQATTKDGPPGARYAVDDGCTLATVATDRRLGHRRVVPEQRRRSFRRTHGRTTCPGTRRASGLHHPAPLLRSPACNLDGSRAGTSPPCGGRLPRRGVLALGQLAGRTPRGKPAPNAVHLPQRPGRTRFPARSNRGADPQLPGRG